MKNKKPQAYSYIRMSTEIQLKGDSLRRQLEATRTYAQGRGLELDEELTDIGKSGYTQDNLETGALGKFMELVRIGEIPAGSFLIIESLDRLSRAKPLSAFRLFSEIVEHGLTIVTLHDKQEYTEESLNRDHGSLFVSLGSMIRAHEESAIKSERLTRVWREKQRQARENKKPVTSKAPAWLSLSDDKLHYVLMPTRSEVIQQVFDDAISGLGKRRIAIQLNEAGVKPWGKSNGWQPSYIAKILTNPATYGRYQPMTGKHPNRVPLGEPIDGYFPPAINRETFDLAQVIIDKRRVQGVAGRRGATFGNLFSKVVFCAVCGGRMRFRDKGTPPKGQKYLVCDGKLRGLGCTHNTYHRYGFLEKNMLNGLFREIDLASIVRENELRPDLKIERDLVSFKIKEKTTQAELLLESFDADSIEVVKEKITALHLEISELKKRKLQLSKSIREQEHHTPIEERLNHIEKLRHKMASSNDNELYKIRAAIAQEIRQVVQRIVFKPDGSLTAYIGGEGTCIPDADGAMYAYDVRKGRKEWMRFALKND
ncbi:recombinase family protein [Desulfocurvus vexinensis]|jgi:DNA invertase Pin-like site-specific DNA recombinase/FtsZ-binding cell division protein ZapB|uniref:recombinase family protein n=1 Tax=Desulfocurvus vexinensis TaxID=399548 RepID=UPI0012EC93E6|nr:recombinase family protein [Desulfocurvus vexinensis]